MLAASREENNNKRLESRRPMVIKSFGPQTLTSFRFVKLDYWPSRLMPSVRRGGGRQFKAHAGGLAIGLKWAAWRDWVGAGSEPWCHFRLCRLERMTRGKGVGERGGSAEEGAGEGVWSVARPRVRFD